MKWGKTKIHATTNSIHPKDKQLIDVSRKWHRVVTSGERRVLVTDPSTGASHEERVEYEYISGAHLVVEPTEVSAATPVVTATAPAAAAAADAATTDNAAVLPTATVVVDAVKA
jgi:hypothetical protein